MERNKPSLVLLPKVINGSVAGIVGVCCVFPVDLVKTRLQNQQHGAVRIYTSMLDCAVKTFRNEGFLGMYRGLGVNLLLITPEKAIKLVGNDFFRHHLADKTTGKLSVANEVLAGGLAGGFQVLVTTPMELLKIQLQDAGRSKATMVNDGGTVVNSHKLTATEVTQRLVRSKGVKGLYKGCTATVLRDVTFSAIYFPLFAHLNSIGKRRDGGTTAVFYVSFLAGLASAGFSSLLVTPFDVVKTRLQLLNKGRGEDTYKGVTDCFLRIVKTEGAAALFKGGGCRMLVIAPLFGIAQTVYYLGIGQKILGHDS